MLLFDVPSPGLNITELFNAQQSSGFGYRGHFLDTIRSIAGLCARDAYCNIHPRVWHRQGVRHLQATQAVCSSALIELARSVCTRRMCVLESAMLLQMRLV